VLCCCLLLLLSHVIVPMWYAIIVFELNVVRSDRTGVARVPYVLLFELVVFI